MRPTKGHIVCNSGKVEFILLESRNIEERERWGVRQGRINVDCNNGFAIKQNRKNKNEFTFSSSGYDLTEEQIKQDYKGWHDGYKFSYKNYNPYTGEMNLPNEVFYNRMIAGYGQGFDEGARFARHEIDEKTFGQACGFSWMRAISYVRLVVRLKDGSQDEYLTPLAEQENGGWSILELEREQKYGYLIEKLYSESKNLFYFDKKQGKYIKK